MDKVTCTSCMKEVKPEVFSGKMFCPECGNEIAQQSSQVEQPHGQAMSAAENAQMLQQKEAARVTDVKKEKSQDGRSATDGVSGNGHSAEGSAVIRDGMGIIENTKNKVGAVETFSDNSITNNTTTNISNVTNIADDTKKSVTCEISGKQILVTSSVKCPECGRTVSNQYYNEQKLRCTLCEQQAMEQYEQFFRQVAGNSAVIDKQLREALDGKAATLKLSVPETREIEIKIRKTESRKEGHLSEMKQRDFDRTIDQFVRAGSDLQSCYQKIAAYAKMTDDDAVQCWYHLLWAVSRPEAYRKALSEADIDSYWQQYWDFAAAVKLGKSAEALDAIDRTREKYPQQINDLTFAQILLEQCQFYTTKDESYLNDAREDMNVLGELESECLLKLKPLVSAIPVFVLCGSFPVYKEETSAKPQQDSQSSGTTGQNAGQSRPSNSAQSVRQGASQPQKPSTAQSQQQRQAQRQNVSQPQRQNVQQSQRHEVQQQRNQDVRQTQDKGIVLNNTAGGPLNPEISFTQTSRGGKKGKSGLWIAAALIAVVLAGGGAFFMLGGKSETSEDKEVISSAGTTATSNKPATMAEKTAGAAAQQNTGKVAEIKEVDSPEGKASEEAAAHTMAQKNAAEKQAMAQQKAASSNVAGTTSSQGDMSETMSKAMKAYNEGDFNTALALFKKEGTAGNAEACYQLGLMLSTGKGSVAKNTLQAKVWLKKAVSLGHPKAQSALDTL